MKLTDKSVRAVQPREKDYKLADGHGLFLLIRPNGTKLWRLKYRHQGKEKMLSFGQYPDVSLKTARSEATENRKMIVKGICPTMQRKAQERVLEAARVNTFEVVAAEWIEKQAHWLEKHQQRVQHSFERYVLEEIGNMPVSDLKSADVLRIARRLEAQGLGETVRRVVQRISGVMRFAVATGRADRDPCPDLRGALKSAPVKHMKALDSAEVPELLRQIDEYDGHQQTRFALKFMSLTFVRTGEMRGALWTEFDLEKGLWRIPAIRMKMDQEHLVPLSSQALGVLAELKKINKDSDYVFPSATSRTACMSENTMLFALYRMGYHGRMTGHGFRSVASSILNESGLWQVDAIERQLAHAPSSSGAVRAAYNRSQYLDERKKMMQWWGDKIDSMKKGAEVLEFKQA